MSRLRVVHTSTFQYASPVRASYNEARMTPLTQLGQTVLESRIDVHPNTGWSEYRDYWGTAVSAFEVLIPHESMIVTAEHLVEVAERQPVRNPAGWETLHGAELRDRLAEFLSDTPTTAPPEDVVELARRVAADLPPAEAALAVCNALRDQVEYIPGATTVHTPASEAWGKRAGVCQDLAHLTSGALRSIGIPARYVSGYLHPDDEAAIGSTVSGDSHAWVEWWVGEWFAYDPTNRAMVGDHHVVIARGRSYDDVPPLRGIFAGAGTQETSVTVEITREA
ncbi:transglutaminase family protein [Cellulomonas sp. URHE0023]|uniref:transglutaminase family protein n=1 Tax=Cellulomonas sp. URHE0023 TaxID=1380354 RepID=UPI0004823EA1|nr:transglutaminase family protein [Cellulomonas sp. URHE0023]